MSKKEEKVEVEAPVSAVKAERKALVAKYEKQNPTKYALKKAALDKWVNEA